MYEKYLHIYYLLFVYEIVILLNMTVRKNVYLCLQLYFGLLRRQMAMERNKYWYWKVCLIVMHIKSCSGQHLLYNKKYLRIDVTKATL